jgi:hypothetical protein
VAEPLELADELLLVVFGGVALLEVVVAQLLVGHALVQAWSAITSTECATAMVALPGPRRPRRRW